MDATEFAEEELRRVAEIKKDKTLQAMILTRDRQIQRLRLKLMWYQGITIALIIYLIAITLVMLWI